VAPQRKGTTRTIAVGFAWPRGPEEVRKAEMASQLPRAFVAGGDLPKAFLDGHELRKLAGWRPLLEVQAGSRLGALLEVGEDRTLLLSVFQDGTRRCSVMAELPEGREGEPRGVVDVCGTVQRVELLQDMRPPFLAEGVGAGSDSSSHVTAGGGEAAGSAFHRSLSCEATDRLEIAATAGATDRRRARSLPRAVVHPSATSEMTSLLTSARRYG